MKKLTYEYVKGYIESFNFTLLTNEYKNANTQLHIKCDKGHEFTRTFSKFKQTQKCPHCINHAISYEEVKKYMEGENYILLSKEYKNNSEKLHMICDKGHECWISWGNFQQGRRCNICAKESRYEKKRYSLEEVKVLIEKYGFEILSDEYINNKTKLKIKCKNCGAIYKRDLTHIRGKCKKCANKPRLTKRFEYVKKYIESKNYTLLSNEYINNSTKLKLQCPEGHIIYMRFADFKNKNNRCKKCANIEQSKRMMLNYDDVKKYIELFNFSLLTNTYEGNNLPLKIKCNNCNHVFERRYDVFKNYHNCPKCNKKYKGEIKIAKVLDELNIKYKLQYRFKDCKFKKTLPFDFYLYELNICIEYDGEGHYIIETFNRELDDFIDGKIRDTVKTIYCEKNNIKLIRIPYWDFDDIKEILEKELNN